jgi:hypothetical protein
MKDDWLETNFLNKACNCFPCPFVMAVYIGKYLSRLREFDHIMVSDHRGSNSQLIDFEGVEICPIFTAKIENSEKSST